MIDSLTRQLLHECMAMCDFAFDSGLRIPSKTASNLELISGHIKNWDALNKALEVPDRLDERLYAPGLTEIHGTLSAILAPSTPRAILLLSDPSHGGSPRFGGAVPLVRRMRVVAMFSLWYLITWSLFDDVNGDPKSYSLVHSHGLPLLLNYFFFLSAASLGACFSALYIANSYVKKGTFDDMYESTYWARYFLGLMAGILMAVVIPIDTILAQTASSIPPGFGPPSLALLGGFAASFVYRLLDQMVKMLESTVKGDPKDEVAAKEMEALNRLESKAMQNRMDQALQLSELQRRLAAGESAADLESTIQELQKQLLEGSNQRLD